MFYRTQHWSPSPLADYDSSKGHVSFGKNHYLKWNEDSGYPGQMEWNLESKRLIPQRKIINLSNNQKKNYVIANVRVVPKWDKSFRRFDI